MRVSGEGGKERAYKNNSVPPFVKGFDRSVVENTAAPRERGILLPFRVVSLHGVVGGRGRETVVTHTHLAQHFPPGGTFTFWTRPHRVPTNTATPPPHTRSDPLYLRRRALGGAHPLVTTTLPSREREREREREEEGDSKQHRLLLGKTSKGATDPQRAYTQKVSR